METVDDFVGRELGVSGWVVLDQERIDSFARCTGDVQWIHTDVARAKRESPFGGTIAHGYLTLSLVASLAVDVGVIPTDASGALNYGLDRVRFLMPVRAGTRVRSRITLLSVERRGGGQIILRMANEMAIEDEDKAALIAESLVMLMV